jgi:DNA-binding FadR family transcriptional regulator
MGKNLINESAPISLLGDGSLSSPSRRALSQEVADALLSDIVRGTYPPGFLLPSESELAEISFTSRATVREAIKYLSSKRVLEVSHGRGTFVAYVSKWTVLDPILLLARAKISEDSIELERGFLEVREIIEVSTARMAATRRSESHLELMLQDLEDMRQAKESKDLPSLVIADIAFHQRIMNAAGNPFLAAIFDPFSDILAMTRYQTSAFPQIQDHAIEHHQKIYDAMCLASEEKVSAAMTNHMKQIQADLEKYVKGSEGSFLSISRFQTTSGLRTLGEKRMASFKG